MDRRFGKYLLATLAALLVVAGVPAWCDDSSVLRLSTGAFRSQQTIHLSMTMQPPVTFRDEAVGRSKTVGCSFESDQSTHGLSLAADESDPDAARDLRCKRGSELIVPFLVVCELALWTDGPNGRKEAVVGAKALAETTLITQALKAIVREKRPDGGARDSFPSGHASAAFAMATTLAEYRPHYKWLAYCVAAYIGWSRVEADRHYWYDVAAGALLGHYVALHVTRSNHVELSPEGISLQWQF